VQFQRTRALTKRLADLNLFEAMQARFTLRDGRVLSLTGFQTINRERLKALTGEQLAELSRFEDLELIYLHLQSMRNLSATAERIGAAASPPSDTAADAAQENSTAPEAVN